MSVTHLLSCVAGSEKCDGGSAGEAALHLEEHGTVTESCASYKWCEDNSSCRGGKASDGTYFDPSTLVPPCSHACMSEGGEYRVVPGTVRTLDTRFSIMTEILRNGPVVGTFRVFGDFIHGGLRDGWKATDGVYVRYPNQSAYAYPADVRSDAYLGNHAVAIVGWGDEPMPHWIVRNSWGEAWNGDGYCKIAMSDANTGANINLCLDKTVVVGGTTFGGCVCFNPMVPGHTNYNPKVKKTSRNNTFKGISFINTQHVHQVKITYVVVALVAVFVSMYLGARRSRAGRRVPVPF